MKLGVIDVGGGLRGVYASGVFDYCLDMGIEFDLCIGVSAGSANVTSYLAGQRKRNYLFYTEYPFRKEYMSVLNYITKRSYLDMEYLYGTLSNSTGENPLDFPALMSNPADLVVIATNALTGKAAYFGKADMKQDDYGILKASCSIPVVCKPFEIGGMPFYDGALGDPVPVETAMQLGCDKVVVILTKPRDVIRTPGKDAVLARMIRKRYPLAAMQLELRAEHYNRGVRLAKEYEMQGRALIVAPEDTCGVDTLTKDRNALKRLYERGYQDGHAIWNFVR